MAEPAKNENVVVLNNVRLSFPVLFKPEQVNGEGDEKFSASFLITPDDTANLSKVTAAMQRVAKSKWSDKAVENYKKLKAADRLAVHDGNLKEYAGYEGMLYIHAGNTVRPLVVDRNPKIVLAERDGRPYSGCYVNCSLEIWAQDNKYGKRINATLRGVQFFADGEAFSGGGVANSDEFDSYEDATDENGFDDVGAADDGGDLW